jgi:predicted Fe-S protein YdhL (DUF1289 family)
MNAADAVSARYPESPCIGVCQIGDDDRCEGCLRTLEEIAAWGMMSEAERASVFRQLETRTRRDLSCSIGDENCKLK